MLAGQRLLVEAAYYAWGSEDLELLGRCLDERAVTYIRLPPGTWPMAGVLSGRKAILASLDRVAQSFEVAEYRPTRMTGDSGVWTCKARVQYAHRTSGIIYDASVRNTWTIRGDKITSYEVIHDADRLRAFFQLVSQADAAR